VSALVVTSLMLFTAIAVAGTASFSFGPAGMTKSPETTSTFFAVGLPGDEPSRFEVAFVVPRDYATDTTIKIAVYIHAAMGTPCFAVLRSDLLVRQRPGFVYQSSASGATPKNGTEIVTFTAGSQILTKVYTVDPAGAGLLADQRAGDGLTIAFFRDTNSASDTCGTVWVTAVDVRYTTP
jgi:hypothetical protein